MVSFDGSLIFTEFRAPWIPESAEAATRGVLYKKVFLEISQNLQENICAIVFFNKVASLRPATLLKKRLWHMYFPVNFAKFLRTSFTQNTASESGRILHTYHNIFQLFIFLRLKRKLIKLCG